LDQASFHSLVHEFLGNELIQEKGEVLFNSLDILGPNDVYLVGFNPGGSGHRTISEDMMLEQNTTPGWSKFDQPWADDLYGTRTKVLLKRIGYDYHNVCITNTFFSASPTVSLLPEMAEDRIQRYMRLHHKFLSIVEPRYLICLGQDAFRSFRGWAIEKHSVIDEGLSDGRFYSALFPEIRPLLLVGTPHPSRGSFVSEKFYENFAELTMDSKR
jgi:hypothetical protein